MTTKQAIEILERHNRWRLGADIDQQKPSDITQAITVLVRYFRDILAIIVFAFILTGCQKERIYPETWVNIKATDCNYEKRGMQVHFTYTGNVPVGANYERSNIVGWCNQWNIKDSIEDYLWMDTCYITKVSSAYMAK
jgi:hypothetical protein